MADQADPAARREMFMALQTVIAGEDVVVGMSALTDALGATIAFASDTQEEAERICRALIGDIIRDMTVNWAGSREARAQAFVSNRLN